MSMTIGPRVTQPTVMPGAGLAGVDVGGRPAGGFGDSVRVTVSPRGGVGDASAVGAAIEADLTRSDALGAQFKAAFTLPPPAMPEGLKGLGTSFCSGQ